MSEIGIRELKQRTSEVIRLVREKGESVTITRRGRVVARLVPVADATAAKATAVAVWADMEELVREIGARWPTGVSAAKAVAEQRREYRVRR